MTLLTLSLGQMLVGLVIVATVYLVCAIVVPQVTRWNAVRRARAHAYRNHHRHVSGRF